MHFRTQRRTTRLETFDARRGGSSGIDDDGFMVETKDETRGKDVLELPTTSMNNTGMESSSTAPEEMEARRSKAYTRELSSVNDSHV